MQELKRRFFALRNGVVTDTMRRAGSPYRIIFGLSLPEISRVAAEFGPDTEMARALWSNTTTRESQLAAPMMVEPARFSIDEALSWVETAVSFEAIDVLCLKLLKRLPEASIIAAKLALQSEPGKRYAAMRLYLNLLPEHADEARTAAMREIELNDGAIYRIARQLISEIEYQEL